MLARLGIPSGDDPARVVERQDFLDSLRKKADETPSKTHREAIEAIIDEVGRGTMTLERAQSLLDEVENQKKDNTRKVHDMDVIRG